MRIDSKKKKKGKNSKSDILPKLHDNVANFHLISTKDDPQDALE